MVQDAKVGADETGATVTACLLIIGNEILSGRTQDKNLAFIGERLNGLGIRLTEARIIPDVEATIVDTLNEVRRHFAYVFTTGGIGPTHDDKNGRTHVCTPVTNEHLVCSLLFAKKKHT